MRFSLNCFYTRMYPELTVTSEEKHSLVITDSSRKKSLGLIKEGMENTVFLRDR